MSTLRVGVVRACNAYHRAFRSPGTRRSLGSNSNKRDARVVGGGSAHGERQQQRGDNGGGGGNNWSEQGLIFVRDLTWLLCVFHCIREYVAEPCLVHGPSMRPTIEHESWVLVNKAGRQSRTLELGQIVLVQSPLEAGRLVVKRITGLPGDSISVSPPPAWDKHNSLGIEKRLEVVPQGHVWLTGDNTDNSKDSRYHGAVPQGLVQGVVSLRLWPPKDFGFIDR
ncbi:unnamed protein product [Scytosiphon promiscuus]